MRTLYAISFDPSNNPNLRMCYEHGHETVRPEAIDQ